MWFYCIVVSINLQKNDLNFIVELGMFLKFRQP